ncbi:class I SAM-dependent methyltransferase [Pseudoduganella violaceinigra]|uniref:class I SAM-dependent methyltransferase n=1 Tax=Pseudoduganella violaceinigra TaxID=246602 RepID=UPI000426F0E2|nr:class I SAM-dependent methyltransferase [Pseudoduganella violaceinigra]
MNNIVAHAAGFANGGGGFKPEYFAELAKAEAGSFWFRARNEVILWALKTYMPNAHNFLEVGCGTGFVLSGIASAHPAIQLSGSEIFLAGLSHAKERVPAAQFMQMDARHVPYADEFDAIGAFDVLEHIEEDDAVLAQLHRGLKAGGLLLLTVPQHRWLWSAADEYACHVRRYSAREIEDKVRAGGFELVRSTSFITALLPAMMLSRQLQKRNKAAFNPDDELKINPVLNQAFYALTMMEFAGIRLGLNYPVGGSRLIVARKDK